MFEQILTNLFSCSSYGGEDGEKVRAIGNQTKTLNLILDCHLIESIKTFEIYNT